MSAVTLSVSDWLLAQPRLGSLPHVLPKLGRNHLPRMCLDFGFTKCAEIGVWRGAYAAQFCEANPNLHMLCVDPWEPHAAWIDTKNALPADEAKAFMAQAHKDAVHRLRRCNATIVRKFSVEAAKDVPDGSLDLAYIDGDHGFNAVMSDLEAWVPKVRAGGLVAGHDYRESPEKPFIHVVAAVNAYTKAHEIDPWFVLAADRSPSFLWVKR